MGYKCDGEVLIKLLHSKVRSTISEFEMLEPGERVIVAVSGGPDSLALLHVLHDLAPELEIALTVGHLHHGLRGAEADADAEFVQDVARGLRLECVVEQSDVRALARERGIGLEEAGREARYAFLRRLAHTLGAGKIAMGHTGSDVAETVLMNLLRGAGLDGLQGIPPRRDNVVRPLIRVTRRETEAFCRSRGLLPRTDRTNFDERFLRARIRHKILPLLQAELDINVEQKLLETVTLLRGDAEILSDLTRKTLEAVAIRRKPELMELRLADAAALPVGLLRRVIREALREVRGELQDLGQRHIAALCELVRDGVTGSEIHLPGGIVARRGYRTVELKHGSADGGHERHDEALRLPVPGTVLAPGGELRIDARIEAPPPPERFGGRWDAWLDLAYCERDLRVRTWRMGDRFEPLGLGGSKKIQDFFVDEKVPQAQRGQVPIVTKADGTVLWVVGHRIDHRARLTDTTQTAVHLIARPADNKYTANGGWRRSDES